MDNYTIAWVVIVVAGCLGAFGFWQALAFIRSFTLRAVPVALAFALLVIPAPLPSGQGSFAPAFLVLIFEAFFQREGDPAQSMAILLFGTLATLIVSVLTAFLISKRLARRASAQPDESAATGDSDSSDRSEKTGVKQEPDLSQNA